jgi:hypothetical protein
MPVTKMGVVYSLGKKHIRRHIYLVDPSDAAGHALRDDAELNHPGWLLPGEGMVMIDLEHHHAGHDRFHGAINAAIVALHGVNAVQHDDPSAHCAVIDLATGVVENVIRADDSIDSLPGKLLVNNADAVVGDVYANGGFTRPSVA